MSMPASRPLPTLRARVRATSASVKRSTMGSSTITREVAVQRWPVEKNAALTTTFTASAISASARTMVGILAAHLELHAGPALGGLHGDLAAGRLRAGEGDGPHVRVGDDLVADLRARPGHQVDRALGDARLVQRLDQPHGAERRQVRRLQHHGVAGDERRARSSRSGMAMGKFHGVISPTTPSGRRRVWMNTRSRSDGTFSPPSRAPSPPK